MPATPAWPPQSAPRLFVEGPLAPGLRRIDGPQAHYLGSVMRLKPGEAVKLFVVKKDPTLTEDQVMDFCKDRLTGYKKPKYIVFRADLPKTNVGKILRRELRDK